jgi:hypothetical protein
MNKAEFLLGVPVMPMKAVALLPSGIHAVGTR